MSAGYASRLSEYKNKGVCGLPESFDTRRSLQIKCNQLATWIQESQHLVVLTGAGVSTSAGIPDFRGPNGIWTQESKAKKTTARKRRKTEAPPTKRVKREEPGGMVMDFAAAKPTLTHRAIAKLAQVGKLKFCVTQNVDGLHRRSGLSRDKHAALHGCAFTETCEDCWTEHFRDFDVGGISFQKTGRKCERCKEGDLRDTLLDWDDALPEDDFERATLECTKADLVITLGTSLRIEPAGGLPMLARRFVVVNLQPTPYDDKASMIIRGLVDDVMQRVMEKLGYQESLDKEDEQPLVERLWTPKNSV